MATNVTSWSYKIDWEPWEIIVYAMGRREADDRFRKVFDEVVDITNDYNAYRYGYY